MSSRGPFSVLASASTSTSASTSGVLGAAASSSSNALHGNRSVFVSDALRRRLTDLRLKGQNQFCADCEASEPLWAAVELGVLVCKECANVHKELVTCPTVQSLSSEKWTSAQVQVHHMIACNSMMVTRF